MTLRRRAIIWAIGLAAVIVIFTVIPRLLVYYSDWLWFGELKQTGVYWTVLLTKLELGLLFGAAFFIIVMGNAYLARRMAPRTSWYQRERLWRLQVAEMMEQIVSRGLTPLLVALILFISLLVGSNAAGHWNDFLLFRHAQAFGHTDPIFHRDLGFYTFRLAFWEYLWSWWFGTLLTTFIITAGVHYLDKAVRLVRGMVGLAPHARTHLSILLALTLLVWALSYRLDAWRLLVADHGGATIAFGAGYTDIHVRLPVLTLMLVVGLLCAVLPVINLRLRGLWLPVAGVAFLIATSMVANWLFPTAVQSLWVKPNEKDWEAPYIRSHISATRRAYNLTEVKGGEFNPQAFTPTELDDNKLTVQNIRLWDPYVIRSTYQQIQALRRYYAFNDVDIDRYLINGTYRQVMLSARELWTENLPERTWQNQHLFFTHGYGLCMSLVNQSTDAGLPELLISDIPPASTTDLKVTRPQIYYGELTNTYVLVKTDNPELDYPARRGGKEGNVYTTYRGKGGVPIFGLLPRLAMAIRFGDRNLLFLNTLKQESRLLMRRNIIERATALAPFLLYDRDPYLVVRDNGRLAWIHDAYTTTDSYPYSFLTEERAGEDVLAYNYIRNSVKVVTDAYDGTTTFYIADPNDPVIKAYRSIFPKLFRALADLPDDLRAHLRYPEGLFRVQCERYTIYHMTVPRLFYTKEDRWAIASRPADGSATTSPDEGIEPYYVLLRLRGEEKLEMVLMAPFSPLTAPNMIAWMAARCDTPHYGELVAYTFPKDRLIWAPSQIRGLINQDQRFSQLKTLLGQVGSRVVHGDLLVLPIGKSLLYVEGIFLAAAQGQIPELKQVVVVGVGRQVHVAPTLGAALAEAIGAAPATATAPALPAASPSPRSNLMVTLESALNHLERSQDRMKAGDWEGYGKEQAQLKAALEKLHRELATLQKGRRK